MDEMAQVFQLEIEGIKLVIQGSAAIATFLARVIRTFIQAEDQYQADTVKVRICYRVRR